ncbi:hypothetical protein QE369_004415 [Agrobacterium larrymoorei]|uniref:Uncharacterized protein n=1 Tax=Agrobacterium larrymoorei TaxID=160699 RepID=A0AAJ2BCH0_9HYPH|nr:hypothetical protein [Agrobacterium larrymoorei]
MLLMDRVSGNQLLHTKGRIPFRRFRLVEAEALLLRTFNVWSAHAPTAVAVMRRSHPNPLFRSLLPVADTQNPLPGLQGKTEIVRSRIQQGVLGFLLKINHICEFLNFLGLPMTVRKPSNSGERVKVEMGTIWVQSTRTMCLCGSLCMPASHAYIAFTDAAANSYTCLAVSSEMKKSRPAGRLFLEWLDLLQQVSAVWLQLKGKKPWRTITAVSGPIQQENRRPGLMTRKALTAWAPPRLPAGRLSVSGACVAEIGLVTEAQVSRRIGGRRGPLASTPP